LPAGERTFGATIGRTAALKPALVPAALIDDLPLFAD
jgi:hypothetical protein